MKRNKNQKNNQIKNEFSIRLVRELYRGINGKILSLKGRENSQNNSISLTYGEIIPQSFLQILLSINRIDGKVFIDLGCGTGVALITAALSSCNFSKVWGIELLPELSNAAESVVQLLTNMIQISKENSKSNNNISLNSLTSTSLSTSTSLKSKSKPKSNEINLKDVIEEIFHNLQTKTLEIEQLVDLICKKIGHREYKKLLKGHKSFKKYLLSFPLDYQIENEEISIITKSTNESEIEDTKFEEELIEEKQEDEKEEKQENEQEKEQDNEDDLNDLQQKRQHRPEAILSLLQSPSGQYVRDGLLPTIQIDCDDIFRVNWWDEADIVYCASLLFSDEMMSMLLERVWKMKPESYFISLKPFPSKHLIRQGEYLYQFEDQNENNHGRKLTLVSDSFYRMSWQMARVYIYQLDSNSIDSIKLNRIEENISS